MLEPTTRDCVCDTEPKGAARSKRVQLIVLHISLETKKCSQQACCADKSLITFFFHLSHKAVLFCGG